MSNGSGKAAVSSIARGTAMPTKLVEFVMQGAGHANVPVNSTLLGIKLNIQETIAPHSHAILHATKEGGHVMQTLASAFANLAIVAFRAKKKSVNRPATQNTEPVIQSLAGVSVQQGGVVQPVHHLTQLLRELRFWIA